MDGVEDDVAKRVSIMRKNKEVSAWQSPCVATSHTRHTYIDLFISHPLVLGWAALPQRLSARTVWPQGDSVLLRTVALE